MTVTTHADQAAAPTTQAAQSMPTGLKPVLDVIPASCHERSTARGLALVGRDLALWVAAIAGIVLIDVWWAAPFLWLVAGLAVSGLFVLGHDAAHQALFDSRALNRWVARLTMAPSLHAAEVWVFGHNRVHHGYTLCQGMDFVWHPSTAEEYLSMPRWQRLRHRVEWGPFGAGAYYLREVWFGKMVRFAPPDRWRRAMQRDKLVVAGYLLLSIVAAGGAAALLDRSPATAAWWWAQAVLIPFLIFCQVIGWVVHVHHIAPEIRWWPRREWNRFRGQVEGTTVLWGPPGWEVIFHWIMVHLPHHVDMAIPCYHLPAAAEAIKAAYPDQVVEERISVRRYLASVRACKVHDFTTGRWSRYPTGH